MSGNSGFLKVAIIVLLALLFGIIIAYLVIRKLTNKEEEKVIKQLRQGTKAKSFSLEILYQKLYIYYLKIPFIKRYLIKLRRRLEIINVQDEYLTRRQTAKILTNMLLLIVPATILIIYLNRNNYLMLFILLISEVFFLDLYIDSRVDKIDNKLLKQQVNFFTDVRHNYHEVNMVEEAIYDCLQDEEEKEMWSTKAKEFTPQIKSLRFEIKSCKRIRERSIQKDIEKLAMKKIKQREGRNER